MWKRIRMILLQGLYASYSASCGDGSGFFNGSRDGTLNLAVTDAPVDDASRVVVEFTGVELRPVSGDPVRFEIDPAEAIDLLALDGAVTTLLDDEEVDAVEYDSIRLLVNSTPDVQDESFIELDDGRTFPLVIDQADAAGLTINSNFTVRRDERRDLVIDFDLRKSVRGATGSGANYRLRPTLRLVDASRVGTLVGEIAPIRLTTNCTPFVYIYTGGDTTPDDMGSAGNGEPLISVPVRQQSSGQYTYRVSHLEAGTYTAAFTCDGVSDTPASNENLSFPIRFAVAIRAGDTTTRDF